MEEAVQKLLPEGFPEELKPTMIRAITKAMWTMGECFYEDGFIEEEEIPQTVLMIMHGFTQTYGL